MATLLDWIAASGKLQAAVTAAGLPGNVSVGADPNKKAAGPYNTFTGSGGTVIGIDWTATPTSQQIAAAGSLITAYDPTPRLPRTIPDLKTSLTSAIVSKLVKLAAIWAYTQDDATLHDMADRSGDAKAAMNLTAAWIKANPNAAIVAGYPISGVK